MAVNVGYLLCVAVILCSFVKSGWSLECYQCNSHNDSRCLKTPLPESMKAPCLPGKDKMCRKITQSVEFEMNGLVPDTRVIRSCGWDDSNYMQRCYQRAGFGGRQEVCSCVGENCNSAAVSGVFATLIISTLALLLRFS